MAIVRPLKAVRPNPSLVSKVAALPYDVIDRREAQLIGSSNEYSFLHISRSEIDLSDNINPYDYVVYEKAKSNLCKMLSDNILIKDTEPSFYLYRQIMNNRTQTGLVACTAIDDYINDIIKKHELTRVEKEIDRINHFDICSAHTEPVFMTYPTNSLIKELIENWIDNNKPIYNFDTEDSISHIVWIVNDEDVISRLQELFQNIKSLYIADGHHRSASAVKVGINRRNRCDRFTGQEEFNYFLSVLFPCDELLIMDYNRVVKDLNGLSVKDFISRIQEKFYVSKYADNEDIKPKEPHVISMFLDKKWYKLKVKKNTYNESDPIERLDVSILQKNILGPILDITDPRTSNRIDFVGGIKGLKELEIKVVDSDGVAFALYPPSMDDLMTISDRGYTMPPKSTWFEPKLRSGLFLHEF